MPNIFTTVSKKNIAVIFSVAIFFLIDRLLKLYVLDLYPSYKNILGDVFLFSFTPNQNIAFSLPLSGLWLNWLITLVIVWLIYIAWPKKSPSTFQSNSSALWLMIAGASSNLLDRWQYGYVIDYLELKYFTVFNLADAMIVISALILIWRVKKTK